MLLTWMQELNGLFLSLLPSPPVSAAGKKKGVFRRSWKVLIDVAKISSIAFIPVGVLLNAARIFRPGAMFLAGVGFAALLAVLWAAQHILERWRLVDKEEPGAASFEDNLPVRRPAPPINEQAPISCGKRPPLGVTGGEAPGRSAIWRLEGDYHWRAEGESEPAPAADCSRDPQIAVPPRSASEPASPDLTATAIWRSRPQTLRL